MTQSRSDAMTDVRRVINRCSGWIPIAMSAAAIALLVLALTTGWERGLKDEGAMAHSWQLLVGLQVPLIVAFLATSDWRAPLRIFAILGLQVLGLVVAMTPVALFRL
jgi:hypothetical protein